MSKLPGAINTVYRSISAIHRAGGDQKRNFPGRLAGFAGLRHGPRNARERRRRGV